jgi:hypothetical protein
MHVAQLSNGININTNPFREFHIVNYLTPDSNIRSSGPIDIGGWADGKPPGSSSVKRWPLVEFGTSTLDRKVGIKLTHLLLDYAFFFCRILTTLFSPAPAFVSFPNGTAPHRADVMSGVYYNMKLNSTNIFTETE